MKTFSKSLVVLGVLLTLSACGKVKEEAQDVIREVSELKESVVETSEGAVEGAKKAVEDAKQALEKAKETVDNAVEDVNEGVEKAKDLVPGGLGTEDEDVKSDTEEDEDAVSGTYHYKSGTLVWVGKKIGGAHEGTIDIKSGHVEIKDGDVTGGNFVINMTTINVTDLEGKSKSGLEDHLEGEDYFDVSNHPTSQLILNSGEDGMLKGKLMIKGITQEVVLDLDVDIEDDEVEIEGDFTIDRTQWDIAAGNVVLKKEIDYTVAVTLERE